MSALDTARASSMVALLPSHRAQAVRGSPELILHTALIAFAGKPPNLP